MSITPAQQAQLLKPFPKNQVEQINAGYAKLDYVSHAYVTQRLLEVDPNWTWRPLALTEQGLPLFDEHNGLWIELTVLGVTRIGYGEPQGSNAHDRRKGAIGNALRVAAMRFGIALHLWQGAAEAPFEQADPITAESKTIIGGTSHPRKVQPMTDKQKALIMKLTGGELLLIEKYKADHNIDGGFDKEEASAFIEWLNKPQPVDWAKELAGVEIVETGE